MADITATIGIRIESTAVARPGDTLIVAVDPAATFEQVKQASEALEERLPGVKVVVVNANDLAVYQPDTLEAQQ